MTTHRESSVTKSRIIGAIVGIPVALILGILIWLQQSEVNNLNQKILELEPRIENLSDENQKVSTLNEYLVLEKDKVALQNAIYTTLVQAIGGMFFFVTAYLTWRNVRAIEDNAEITEEKQISERFSVATTNLGNEHIEVRLGGIYALEQVARDSHENHWTAMEVLSSFIQTKSPFVKKSSAEQNVLSSVPADVQAALTVIGRRDIDKDDNDQQLDLSHSNLSGAHLRGAKLCNVNLEGCNLTEANLIEADLRGTNLCSAVLCRAELEAANLSAARLSNADLRSADLKEANLTYAVLGGADFSNARLDDANLVECDCKATPFYKHQSDKTDTAKANFSGASLRRADLHKANLEGANLHDVDLTSADLSDVTGLTVAQLSQAYNSKGAILPETPRLNNRTESHPRS